MPDTWTVLRLLTWTTDFLKSRGADSPRLDAEVLLAHARGCERIMLYTAFDQVVDEGVRARFRELVAHLLEFHRRAEKPEWWAMFDRQDRTTDELVVRASGETLNPAFFRAHLERRYLG